MLSLFLLSSFILFASCTNCPDPGAHSPRQEASPVPQLVYIETNNCEDELAKIKRLEDDVDYWRLRQPECYYYDEE